MHRTKFMEALRTQALVLGVTLPLLTAPLFAADAAGTQPALSERVQTQFNAFFPGAPDTHASPLSPTSITKADYLRLIAGDIDFFLQHQDNTGAIIDPYAHTEIQYATPSFALAAGTLVKEAGRKDLLNPACKALSQAITELVTHRTAGQHADFFIPLIVHAYRELKDLAPATLRADWNRRLAAIIPEDTYRMDLRHSDWNLVSSLGELLRRQEGLVRPEYAPSQWKYLEESLRDHRTDITAFGLIRDPHLPSAEDEVSRLWLEDIMASHAYDGELKEVFQHAIHMSGMSELFLLSPTGEWEGSSHSKMYTWNEAKDAFICELHAAAARRANRVDVAGAFKRGAHLAFQSLQRWRRPSGELFILHNRADPSEHLGFDSFSYDSQYNLFSAAVLSMAYTVADDGIPERATPSERGGYIFDMRTPFHEIAAAAGGYYVVIDTTAIAQSGATGLQRVQRTGVPFSTLSDSVPIDRGYRPATVPNSPMTPGLSWHSTNSPDAPWRALADFGEAGRPLRVESVQLTEQTISPALVKFSLTYNLTGEDAENRELTEQYTITSDGVDCITRLSNSPASFAFRGQFPILVSDGATNLPVKIDGTHVTVEDQQCTTTFTVLSPQPGKIQLLLPKVVNRYGWVQKAVVPLQTSDFHYHITLSSTPE